MPCLTADECIFPN